MTYQMFVWSIQFFGERLVSKWAVRDRRTSSCAELADALAPRISNSPWPQLADNPRRSDWPPESRRHTSAVASHRWSLSERSLSLWYASNAAQSIWNRHRRVVLCWGLSHASNKCRGVCATRELPTSMSMVVASSVHIYRKIVADIASWALR